MSEDVLNTLNEYAEQLADPRQKQQALFELSNQGLSGAQVIVAALEHADPAVRKAALNFTITSSFTHHNLSVPVILRVARQDEDPTIRKLAFDKLYGRRGDFRDEIAPVLIDAMTDPDAPVRAAALNLARYLRPRPDFDPQQLATLIMTDPDQIVRLYAITNYRSRAGSDALKSLGDPVRDTLLAILEQPAGTYDANVQLRDAISGLEFFPEKLVVERLQEFLKRSDIDDLLRHSVTQVLNNFARYHEMDAIAEISAGLKSASAAERMAAIKSLQMMTPTGESIDVLLNLLKNGSKSEQIEAALALSQVKNRTVREAITEAIAEGRVPFGKIAQALARRGDLSTMSTIYAGLADAPDAVRQRAAKEMEGVREYIDRMSRLY